MAAPPGYQSSDAGGAAELLLPGKEPTVGCIQAIPTRATKTDPVLMGLEMEPGMRATILSTQGQKITWIAEDMPFSKQALLR